MEEKQAQKRETPPKTEGAQGEQDFTTPPKSLPKHKKIKTTKAIKDQSERENNVTMDQL